MTPKMIIAQAKALLQAILILISVGLVPVMVGMVGRSLAANHSMAVPEAQTVGPVLQW
jgi:hypothetical protein